MSRNHKSTKSIGNPFASPDQKNRLSSSNFVSPNPVRSIGELNGNKSSAVVGLSKNNSMNSTPSNDNEPSFRRTSLQRDQTNMMANKSLASSNSSLPALKSKLIGNRSTIFTMESFGQQSSLPLRLTNNEEIVNGVERLNFHNIREATEGDIQITSSFSVANTSRNAENYEASYKKLIDTNEQEMEGFLTIDQKKSIGKQALGQPSLRKQLLLDEKSLPNSLQSGYNIIGMNLAEERKELQSILKWLDIADKNTKDLGIDREDEIEISFSNCHYCMIFFLKLLNKDVPEKAQFLKAFWNRYTKYVEQYFKLCLKNVSQNSLGGDSSEDLNNAKNKLSEEQNLCATLKQRNAYLENLARKLTLDNKEVSNELEELKKRFKSVSKVLRRTNSKEFPVNTGMNSQGVDTKGLITCADKGVLTFRGSDFIQDAETQTNLLDVIDIVNKIHTKALQKSEFEDVSAYSTKLQKLNINLSDSVTMRDDIFKIRQEQAHNFRAQDYSKLELLKKLGGLQSLNNITQWYITEMEKFFFSLNTFFSSIEANSDAEKHKVFKQEALNSKKIYEEFTSLLAERDIQTQSTILDIKLEVVERETLMADLENRLENWQLRYNFIFKNMRHFQDLYLSEKDILSPNTNTTFLSFPKENISSTTGQNLGDSSQKLTSVNSTKLTKRNSLEIPSLSGTGTPGPTPNLARSYKRKGSLITTPSKSQEKFSSNEKSSEDQKIYVAPSLKSDLIKFLNAEEDLKKPIAGVIKGNLLADNTNLRKKKVLRDVQSVNGTLAVNFMSKIKHALPEPKEELSLETFLRSISALMSELLKQGTRRNKNPLYFHVYDYVLNRNGNVQRNTEFKLLGLIKTALYWKSCYPRISLFLKFITITANEPYEYDGEELFFYFECLQKLDTQSQIFPGLSILMNTKPRNLILLRDAIALAINFFEVEHKMNKYFSLEALLQELKNDRDDTPEGEHIHMIDVDLLIDKLIKLRYDYYEKVYREVFQLVEIYGCNSINYDQFYFLVRTFHPNINDIEAFKMFHERYDLIDEEEQQKFISFRTFGLICEEKNLFGEEDIKQLLSYSMDNIYNFDHLAKEWRLKLKLMKLKFIKSKKYSSFIIKMLRKIEEDLNPRKNDPLFNQKWLRYKMIDKDANMSIINFELDKFIPSQLLDFQKQIRFIFFDK